MMRGLKVRGIEKSYSGKTVLSVDALDFAAGRIYAVIGANGSGKSTLARIVSGVEKPDRGSVDACGASVGFMPQRSYAFYGTVRKNVRLGMSAAGRVGREKVDALLESLGIAHLAGASAKGLSGGETARMALARLLVGEHGFIVLDEPTASLDVKSTLAAEGLLRRYRDERGAGIMLVTHSIKQVRRIADEVMYLEKGSVVESGTTDDVLGHTKTAQLQNFLDFA